jgi:hypothetical protein
VLPFSTVTFIFSKYTFGVTVAVVVFFSCAVGIRIDYSTQLVSCDGTETYILVDITIFWERPDNNLMYDSDC